MIAKEAGLYAFCGEVEVFMQEGNLGNVAVSAQ